MAPIPFSLALCLAPSAQGPFLDEVTVIPSGPTQNGGDTENIDFGDIDGDGDWDVVFANGGDLGTQQNRIWINLGPASLGVFEDQTAIRFPAIADSSRDIDLVDFDGDGWLDVHVSNHSTHGPEPCRWWRNTGGGFFIDETAARWIGLGAAGSSISPTQLIASGGFIDFVGDSEFGDLDNDGDLDLVHSSYGGAYGGQVPTRLFLNDGQGHFREFNPSGFQVPTGIILDGMPALWAEGIQQANTLDSTGTFADVATTCVDADLADIDGDFDLDLLLGARMEPPRMFRNRLTESGGSLRFRDVTGAVFPPGYATGFGHYEQEFGDMDGDGDLDIYGVNYLASGFAFHDCTLRNDGSGSFVALYQVPFTQADAEEADFLDFDNDGDLDVFIASYGFLDKLYRNVGGVTNNLQDATNLIPPSIGNLSSRDGQVCDVDGDGDYDIFVAMAFNQRNVFLRNAGGVPDTHAPYIPNVEQAPDRLASPAPTVIRAQIYDNAPSYITKANPTHVEYTVDGSAPVLVPAAWSGAQIFRAELPGPLVGTICYRWVSSDGYGNSGRSQERCYQALPTSTGTPVCFGDGSGAPCPCGNDGGAGSGCANQSFASGSTLAAAGTPSVSADTLVLLATGSRPGQPGLFFQGNQTLGAGLGVPFGDGLRCAGGSPQRIQVRTASALGVAQSTLPLALTGGVGAGQSRTYQWYYRDPGPSPCGSGFNLSNGLELTWVP